MQGDVQLANILERHLGDVYMVSAFVSLRRMNKLVPQTAELVLEFRQSTFDIEFANRL
jgi:hypothetical protein